MLVVRNSKFGSKLLDLKKKKTKFWNSLKFDLWSVRYTSLIFALTRLFLLVEFITCLCVNVDFVSWMIMCSLKLFLFWFLKYQRKFFVFNLLLFQVFFLTFGLCKCSFTRILNLILLIRLTESDKSYENTKLLIS